MSPTNHGIQTLEDSRRARTGCAVRLGVADPSAGSVTARDIAAPFIGLVTVTDTEAVSSRGNATGRSRPLARHAGRAAALAAVAGLAALPAPAAALPGADAGADRRDVVRRADPDRVVVSDRTGVLATFTVGARTVTLRGPRRTFSEPSTTASMVSTTAWVRLLPTPYSHGIDRRWLAAALSDRSPDVLAVAAEYLPRAPTRVDPAGRIVSSDASYGPLDADGRRVAGADVNDYLGIEWVLGSRTDRPEPHQLGSLDCSGFVRMVLGYRLGVPLSLDPDGTSLPRRAVAMAASGTGVLIVPDTGARARAHDALLPGDLVFSDVSTDDGPAIDHVGIYLGTDSSGAARFVSSRKAADGPTMGDLGGRSTLTGSGLYAQGFRAARRV